MVRTKAVCQRQRLLLRERMTKQTSYGDSSVVQLVIRVPWLCLVGSGCDLAWFRRRLIGKGLTKTIRLGQNPKLQSADEHTNFQFCCLVSRNVQGKVEKKRNFTTTEDLEDWQRLTTITLCQRHEK
ncbi:hypothetical protein FOQG_15864 [Fusarium oxysporum f. sp. raphani 54005]|uniref:Uncharacterized protein n=3 Tax=Fusarium oxysporum TaxID=5507 RepID=X0CA47_FUSOX|nr:hypothetical protein FOVG_04767 [Fusarium oxysporum f. sp. pisi HDV247]EXK79564.1 hypothetical protein FOQG_15864 [Fusarium oxysporum f. sp. raphani 54005]EXL87446.1 hypothetical protein FOPG_01652 [Fusarium oxysporum f. sp. conglutinans race 2 54008]EXA47756.1 hypothetical protein FOVG_04767 [Fusarium oxysporum f. sp. pisi HDV247]EXK79565.1 hypothetical protein FOQG_15864 [Fusarium oxysporum f. sp. raphani 54005]